jgi:hypothetical protein
MIDGVKARGWCDRAPLAVIQSIGMDSTAAINAKPPLPINSDQ